MAALSSKTLRPAGEGRKLASWDWGESNQILSAARRGDIDTLVSMSHRGIDITTAASSYGDSVLHAAIDYGQLETLRALLSTGMPVNVRNYNESTPLHYAAANVKTDVVDILIAAGATVDVMNQDGNTPLANAVRKGHVDTVKTLLRHNADPTKLSQVLQGS